MPWLIGKTFRFEAAHFLPDHDGQCRELHGHSYEVEVQLCGQRLQKGGSSDGMVVDFADIKSAVAPLIKSLDHNGLVQDHMDGRPSTAEGMAHWLFALLQDEFNLDSSLLHAVIVKETAGTFAEYRHPPTHCDVGRPR